MTDRFRSKDAVKVTGQRDAPLPEAAKMVLNAGIAGSEEGQSLMEYALILVLVALVAITGLTAYGTQLRGVFQTIVSTF